jgi:PAS domain S-box-containing protein
MNSEIHYLKKELYERIQKDPVIFEFLQSGSLDGIWYWDLENQENEWMSPRFWTILGYDPEEKKHLASEWQDLIYPEDLTVAIENFKKHCVDPNHPYDQVVRYLHKNGSTVWIRCRGIAIRDKTGKPVRMLGAHTDLTPQKQAERALRESEDRYRRLISAAQEGVYLVNEETKIVFVNKQMETMLGYTYDEMWGQLLMDFMDEFAPVDLSVDFHRHSTGSEQPRDFRFRRKDGSTLWGMVSSSALYDDNGKFTGALGLIIDVTRRKEAEQKLKQAHEELKGFVDVIAHDLKNPLLGITGFLQLLLKTHRDQLEKKGVLYIEQIQDSANQMSQLISDLLSFSRIGYIAPDFKSIPVNEIVETVCKRLRHMIECNDIDIVISENLPTIYCDSKTIYQVFENLLSNAIKFTTKVDSPKIEFGYTDSKKEHQFYVKDNGAGIDPKHHGHIFNMFYRIRDAEHEDGTGLGLAIVKKIVTMHGGKVWVKSEEEQGATFYFALPKEP